MRRPAITARAITARAVIAAVLSAAALHGVGAVGAPAAAAAVEPQVAVIVRETSGAGSGPERLVEVVGGTVDRQLPVVEGFLAHVPTSAMATLRAAAGVVAVTPDAPVRLTGSFDGFAPKNDLGSMYWVGQEVTGAGEYWNAGFRGQGVDIALIDSGVAPIDGLTAPGKVLHGPDLSFESQHDVFRNTDTYGHGTHMAGIIAGRDTATPQPVQKGVENHFVGIAPEARIVSVKVADSHGNTDVSQVIAAIDWVVQHRNDAGMNIRVLNLSFGTDGVQDYRFDPLSYAAEVAWRAGIVVVVAAGNRGDGSEKLNNPAYNPFVLAVGGADGQGTYGVSDDVIGSFSSHGDAARVPDLVAPGKSVVSLLAPGSRADVDNPGAQVGTRQIRGSGTSQSAAVVSGAAALVISQRPGITPDQVKKLLRSTARTLPAADLKAQGAGMIDLKAARTRATPSTLSAVQPFTPALGTGSLDASRGSGRLSEVGVELGGERDIFGAPFLSSTWAVSAAAGTSWTGGTWNANRWSGQGWTANRWSSALWSANRWSGQGWSSQDWSANRWSANRWSGDGWLANRWSANRWSANRWSAGTWG
jgi:serine protease AprX